MKIFSRIDAAFISLLQLAVDVSGKAPRAWGQLCAHLYLAAAVAYHLLEVDPTRSSSMIWLTINTIELLGAAVLLQCTCSAQIFRLMSGGPFQRLCVVAGTALACFASGSFIDSSYFVLLSFYGYFGACNEPRKKSDAEVLARSSGAGGA